MNILFISNDPSIFTPESNARARMRTYAKEIGTLHILSPGRAPDKKQKVIREEIPGGGVLVLHTTSLPKPFCIQGMVKQARALIAKESIELVSAQDPFEYGWVALQATQGTKAKLHIQIHTDPFTVWFTRGNMTRISHMRMPMQNRARIFLADKVIPKADGIRVVSERIRDEVVARYPKRKAQNITVIPIAVPNELPPPIPLPAHSFSFAFITVGRLEPEKRIQDIIHAIGRIHLGYPAIGLFIVGEGSLRKKLERTVQHLGLENNIIFLGNRSDAVGLMQSAQGYVQASAYEGYSRTLIEAALCRIPIITTDVGIVGEVFRGYEEVLVAPPGDPGSLAFGMMGLVQDVQARRTYVMNAEKAARTHLATVQTTPAAIAADLRTVLGTAS
jgi:glycosyltransferase involved in cell wall biosynthesis